jgi:plasmid stabilization system protein ParE
MNKKYTVWWAAPARDDVNEIVDYIEKTNEVYAVKVLDNIEKNVEKLKEFPKSYRIVLELDRAFMSRKATN